MISKKEDILKKIKIWRLNNKKIIFTNGCFDLLHQGHIDLLNQAKSFGEILIVGLNSDLSIRRLKGVNRPIEILQIRSKNLWDLGIISAIIPFDSDTPMDLIKMINPDFLVKGGDYNIDEIIGSQYIQSMGGAVKVVPITPGFSTTKKIKKLGL
mgnify:CR=1 FL=1